MNNNINQDLYSRFGLKINIESVQDGCRKYFKGIVIDALGPITNSGHYKDAEKLLKNHDSLFEEICRQLFLDSNDYYAVPYTSILAKFISEEISDEFSGSFDEYLFRLQLLINLAHKYIPYEVGKLALELDRYFQDFLILGLMIKIYKKKPPQILPSTSKKFELEVKNTLGLLETGKEYGDVLSHYESGLKEFLIAKNQAAYKDAIEDAYTACDELVKVVLKDKNKGFKHISDKDNAIKLGLNGHQKELFKNLRNWVDEIKHGTLKIYDRKDTEMIISLVGSLIRYIILNHVQTP
jgi:hypothetical protein